MAPPKKQNEKQPISANDVLEYLRQNPNFLLQNPELLESLTPPNRHSENKVVDMQNFMLRKLQADNGKLREVATELVHSSRETMSAQQRVHSAVISLLSATCLEDLLNILASDLVMILGIDAVSLCLAADEMIDPPAAESPIRGIEIIDAYYLEDIMEDRAVLIRPDVQGDPALFGGSAGLVRSDALVRLYISDTSPDGVLALGSRKLDAFQSAYGAELLGFLGQVVEICIRNWLETYDE